MTDNMEDGVIDELSHGYDKADIPADADFVTYCPYSIVKQIMMPMIRSAPGSQVSREVQPGRCIHRSGLMSSPVKTSFSPPSMKITEPRVWPGTAPTDTLRPPSRNTCPSSMVDWMKPRL